MRERERKKEKFASRECDEKESFKKNIKPECDCREDK